MALRLSTGLRNKLCGINSNKVTNGSFTTDTTGWTAVNAVLSSVTGGQSGNALQITTNSANVAQAYQDVICKKGRLYFLQVYYKDGTASNSARVYVGQPGNISYYYDSGAVGSSAWKMLEVSPNCNGVFFKTDDGTGTETIRITLSNENTSNTGKTVLFDEVKLISMDRSLQDLFYRGNILIYSGSQPASADDAPTGTLLVTIYSDGSSAGLSFDDASFGTLSKKATETWTGTVVANGTAGWFRLISPGDSGSSSTTDERIDGAIATTGAEMNFSSLTMTAGAIQAISTFQITIPAS